MKNIDKIINLAVFHQSYRIRKKNAKRYIKYLFDESIGYTTEYELVKKFYIACGKKRIDKIDAGANISKYKEIEKYARIVQMFLSAKFITSDDKKE